MEHAPPSDETLTAAIQSGDRAVFSRLIREHQRAVFFLALRMTRGDEPFARDIVQKTFLAAWRHRATFRGDASFRTWAMRIAHNQCLNELGRAWRRRELGTFKDDEPGYAAPSDTEDAFDRLARGEAKKLLGEAIAALPQRQRSVATLRLYGDMSFAEVAEVCDITVNNAKVNFHHAVRNIREFLAKQGVAA